MKFASFLVSFFVMAPTLCFAQIPTQPSIEQLTATCNIQVGQDRTELGQQQMEVIRLKTQLQAEQAKSADLQKQIDALKQTAPTKSE